MDENLQPVIIGVGQQTWRERDSRRTPVDALQAVTTAAASDTGSGKVLGAVDAIVHIPFVLNQIPDLASAMPRNPGAALAGRLGISAAQYTADVGGNLPQQLINDFSGRLQQGHCEVVLVAGAELLASFLGAVRSGEAFPDWNTGIEEPATPVVETPPMSAPTELAHGLFEPVNVYPLFESALRHADGLDEGEHLQRLGKLVSAMSDVAAANEYAWKRRSYRPEEVLSTDGGNRIISAPYRKLMNAIIAVDQAAAVILTTVGKARELGVAEDQWIYLRGAASAHDPWYVTRRESFSESAALRTAAAAAMEQSGLSLVDMSHFDLYSCFPSAVQVAARAIGLSLDDPRGVTVTGGLTLFGGPGNNYSLHAIAEMAQVLRATQDGAGLVTANGGYLTKHSVGIYSRRAGPQVWSPLDEDALQREVDARDYPELLEEARGPCVIEAHTVTFKGSEPGHGIVIGRLDSGARFVAVVEEQAGRDQLLAEDCVGRTGCVDHREGRNYLTF